MYVKSNLDSVTLLSIINEIGPLPLLSLDPAIHSKNVLVNVLKQKENVLMKFLYYI